MTAEPPAPAPPPAPEPPAPTGLRGRRVAIAFGILVAVIAIYVLSLIGVHLLAKSSPPLPELDISNYHEDDTAVELHVEELKTVANRLIVNVLVYPAYSIYDQKFGVLTSDAAVRLYPVNNLGDLQYPKGKAPAPVATKIEAHGDPGNWPFDTYRTDEIGALVFTGDYHDILWCRMEVTGSLDGWDVSVKRVHVARDTNSPNSLDNVIITLQRAKGPLIFDLGIALILISLPTMALVVAIPMALGRTTFLPPFATWYAAMLFAIVPLRNILPGSPPPGSWVDQAVVLWVLIALIAAMALYIVAWARHEIEDRRKRPNTDLYA
jgi:hypothetical protein